MRLCSGRRKKKIGFVSIHASVKDATQHHAFKTGLYLVSIHASVKDATGIPAVYFKFKVVSIHASVKDATYFKFKVEDFAGMFQSTHL